VVGGLSATACICAAPRAIVDSVVRWRDLVEQSQGIALDVVAISVATTVATPALRDWLRADLQLLYHVTVVLHLVACPALLVAVVLGHGKAGTHEELQRRGPGVLGVATALLWCSSFVIPGVLGLLFRPPIWLFMTSVFAPVAVFPLWMVVIVVLERRGIIAPTRVGERKPWWSVQALAVLGWAYLIALEMMMLTAAGKTGPLVEVGLPLGILIDYLPARIVLYYVRLSSGWELATMIASIAYLLVRIAMA
jgi:hypothetical protein